MKEDNIIKTIGCLILWVMIPINMFVNGWAIQLTWGWFIHPLGLPYLTLFHAIGIAIVAALLTHYLRVKDFKDDDTTEELIIASMATSLVKLTILGIGYIVALMGGFA